MYQKELLKGNTETLLLSILSKELSKSKQPNTREATTSWLESAG